MPQIDERSFDDNPARPPTREKRGMIERTRDELSHASSALRDASMPPWLLLLIVLGPSGMAGLVGGATGHSAVVTATDDISSIVRRAVSVIEAKADDNGIRLARLTDENRETQSRMQAFVGQCNAERSAFIEALRRNYEALEVTNRQVKELDRQLKLHMRDDDTDTQVPKRKQGAA